MADNNSASSLESEVLTLKQALFKPILQKYSPPTKISVIGAGNVGMAIAQTILTQDLTDELVLVNQTEDKVHGEVLDLQHAAAFLPRTKIHWSTNYVNTSGSDICIVTAGKRQVADESGLNLLEENLKIFKHIIPQLAWHSPRSILIIVSNPVDVLTNMAWKLSGFPPNQVIGSGTNLDSSRFRSMIADWLDVNAQDVQAYVVGEHGGSSVALWSSVSVGGVPIISFLDNEKIPYEKDNLEKIHKAVVGGANEVIKLKGYTSWAIGYSVANLVRSILRDQRKIHPVSVLAEGFYDINEEVFLSLPAKLGRSGVLGVINMHLTEAEKISLKESADAIFNAQSPNNS